METFDITDQDLKILGSEDVFETEEILEYPESYVLCETVEITE